MIATHTPLDSLTYIEASSPLLEWAAAELDGSHGETPDLDACVALLSTFRALIRTEVDTHGHRAHYSSGHPVRVQRHQCRIEPDPSGVDRIEWVPLVHVCTPDGAVQGVDDGPP